MFVKWISKSNIRKNLLLRDLVREDTLISGFCRKIMFVGTETITEGDFASRQSGWSLQLLVFYFPISSNGLDLLNSPHASLHLLSPMSTSPNQEPILWFGSYTTFPIHEDLLITWPLENTVELGRGIYRGLLVCWSLRGIFSCFVLTAISLCWFKNCS